MTTISALVVDPDGRFRCEQLGEEHRSVEAVRRLGPRKGWDLPDGPGWCAYTAAWPDMPRNWSATTLAHALGCPMHEEAYGQTIFLGITPTVAGDDMDVPEYVISMAHDLFPGPMSSVLLERNVGGRR